MKSKDRKLLDSEGFWNWYYGWDCDYEWDDISYYEEYCIEYSIDDNRLIDWSEEIPLSKQRLNKIDFLLLGKDVNILNKSIPHSVKIESFFIDK